MPWPRAYKVRKWSGGHHALAVVVPKLWNDPPQHIREASSLSGFKCLVKTHLFSLAFDTWEDIEIQIDLFILLLFIMLSC